ncbi:MAG: YndJ family protein, partial [Actinomycetota bacterium]|nr:YndJ family protein [Actinomycetota bacterium]
TGAAASLVAAFLLETGPLASVLVVPLVVAATATLVTSVRRAGPLHRWRLDDAVPTVAGGYALVASGAMVASRLGASPFGVSEPIVELTAAHYLYAGTGALVLAGLARAASGPGRVGMAAVGLTAAAPPVVALGFLTSHPLPQIGGAALMTAGVWLTASLQLVSIARADGPRLARLLLAVSGLAVWVPMILALAWATGQHIDVPALSIPDMVRTHGMANALAFTLCGLAGHHLAGHHLAGHHLAGHHLADRRWTRRHQGVPHPPVVT